MAKQDADLVPVQDNGFLETVPMRLRSANDAQAIQAMVNGAKNSVTPYGNRHSQGGQTLSAQGTAVDLDAMQRVEISGGRSDPSGRAAGTCWIGAGATWDHLHHALFTYGQQQRRTPRSPHLAPMTHQSSVHFSVGGSLAVNCHGRDPRQGPVCDSVLALDVVTGKGDYLTNIRPDGKNPDLFHAVLGGMGSGAIIVRAQLALKPERVLILRSDKRPTGKVKGKESLADYLTKVAATPTSADAHFYAWLQCAGADGLFDNAIRFIGVEATDTTDEGDLPDKVRAIQAYSESLADESLLTDEILSTLYRQYRKEAIDKKGSKEKWDWLMGSVDFQKKMRRELNVMRNPIRFTQAYPDEDWVDLMQEYFLPPDKFSLFIDGAKKILGKSQNESQLVVLTSTVRMLAAQQNKALLTYASRNTMRVAVVLNMAVKRKLVVNWVEPREPLKNPLGQLIELAIEQGGSYYPCYGRFASVAQWRRAFDANQIEAHAKIRKKNDPTARLTNRFWSFYGR